MPAENIIITENIQKSLKHLLESHTFSQIGVLVDENTLRDCYPVLQNLLPRHTLYEIRSGEVYKNLITCSQIWEWLTQKSFDRKGLLINLGGGVIGDMGGFCAATFKRGIRFINLPTTLLSQVDASVGGKLGIDFQGFKNHIGLFQEPLQVIIYPEFLKTLPPRELRSGFAEVIKHSLIADADYWPEIEGSNLENQNWLAHIRHSVQVKSEVVDQDFRESGLRKILNFGHTIGHAIESFYLESEKPLLHGEAIAIGMICESYLSEKYCGMPYDEIERVEKFIHYIFGYTDINDQAIEAIVKMTLQDKKNESSSIRGTLLEYIGKARYDVPISPQNIQEALQQYKKRLAQ